MLYQLDYLLAHHMQLPLLFASIYVYSTRLMASLMLLLLILIGCLMITVISYTVLLFGRESGSCF